MPFRISPGGIMPGTASMEIIGKFRHVPQTEEEPEQFEWSGEHDGSGFAGVPMSLCRDLWGTRPPLGAIRHLGQYTVRITSFSDLSEEVIVEVLDRGTQRQPLSKVLLSFSDEQGRVAGLSKGTYEITLWSDRTFSVLPIQKRRPW